MLKKRVGYLFRRRRRVFIFLRRSHKKLMVMTKLIEPGLKPDPP